MTEYTLKEIIDFYDNGVISDSVLVKWLSEWEYKSRSSNNEYIEGSFDDVEEAHYKGVISADVYFEALTHYLGEGTEDTNAN